jgi:mono/diheme cytochrome c family protein
MLFALSTGHQIGLAATGGAFILFALLSSFVFPRMDPDFPSRKGLRWYLPLSALFFVAMMSAVLVFGKEQKPAEANATPAEATTTTTTQPAGGGKLTSGPYANGDPVAGKALFAANGCAGCHTLKAAGASGVTGPDLDKLVESAATAGQPLGEFTAESIANPDAYVAPGYSKGLMPPYGKSLSATQIADLVAFIDDSVSGSS